MKLCYKPVGGAGVYLFYPGEKNRTPWKRSCITFLLDQVSEERINLLLKEGLEDFSLAHQVILSFPVPKENGWNISDGSSLTETIHLLTQLQSAVNHPGTESFPVNSQGIPTLEAMLKTWHPMADVQYYVGEGMGATLALAMAATTPSQMAGFVAINGDLPVTALERALLSPVPAFLLSCTDRAIQYLKAANRATMVKESPEEILYFNKNNPLQQVVFRQKAEAISASLVEEAWNTLFSQVHRTNSGFYGDCEPRDHLDDHFIYYIDDTSLDGTPHTWFLHCPENGKAKMPVMIFLHGGSDNPEEAAVMSRFHKIGEREQFITVYPWATNRCFWNNDLSAEGEDDLTFLSELLDYVATYYPVDRKRVYVSGFSNGAAMAQAFALAYPNKVAALCHIDSNWPGVRCGVSDVNWKDVKPFVLGMERKKQYDYRMPVWYTYGSREISYPIVAGCSQQHQYDFWKMYNNIHIAATPSSEEPDSLSCGVPGEEIDLLTPSERHPNHWYEVNRFFSQDPVPLNLYNYVIMHDKGHDIAEMDTALAWDYVKHFYRNKDGSLGFLPF